MSSPLYDDMVLTDEKKERVRAWLHEVGLSCSGAGPDDFDAVSPARYLGFWWINEDLETFAVGLQCTAPGLEHVRTRVRMSRGQLMGEAGAPTYEDGAAPLATDAMRMTRWRSRGLGPGGDVGDGVPGTDLDLAMVSHHLEEVIGFAAEHGADTEAYGWYELSVQWGILAAGRLPRVEHFARAGSLSGEQLARLTSLHERVAEHRGALMALELAVPAAPALPAPVS